MHERRDNVLGTDVLGNFRLALECANLNFPTLETFEMALMRSFKLLLTHDTSTVCRWTSRIQSWPGPCRETPKMMKPMSSSAGTGQSRVEAVQEVVPVRACSTQSSPLPSNEPMKSLAREATSSVFMLAVRRTTFPR